MSTFLLALLSIIDWFFVDKFKVRFINLLITVIVNDFVVFVFKYTIITIISYLLSNFILFLFYYKYYIYVYIYVSRTWISKFFFYNFSEQFTNIFRYFLTCIVYFYSYLMLLLAKKLLVCVCLILIFCF